MAGEEDGKRAEKIRVVREAVVGADCTFSSLRALTR
jgi:hypothetical protein